MKPHEGQFKPGQSGNPNGRPKGSKNISKLPRPERALLSSKDSVIQNLLALAKNDKEKLKRDAEVPASVQLSAIQRVLDLVKEIEAKLADMDEDDDVGGSNVSPLFSTKAK